MAPELAKARVVAEIKVSIFIGLPFDFSQLGGSEVRPELAIKKLNKEALLLTKSLCEKGP
jgi:hypothetical protein